jgi:hypothetical protein
VRSFAVLAARLLVRFAVAVVVGWFLGLGGSHEDAVILRGVRPARVGQSHPKIFERGWVGTQ